MGGPQDRNAGGEGRAPAFLLRGRIQWKINFSRALRSLKAEGCAVLYGMVDIGTAINY